MMKPKTFRQGTIFKTSQPQSDKLSIPNEVKLPNLNLRKRKITPVKRSNSVSASRNSSTPALTSTERLTVSASMKTLCLGNEEKPVLSRNVMANNLRVMAKKKRELTQMQKTLLQQQDKFMDLFAQVKDLEMQSGVDSSKSIGEARLLSVQGWSRYDLLMLVRSDPKLHGHTDIKGVLGPATLTELNSLLSKIPEEVLSMAADLMARRLEILQYLCARVRADTCHFPDWKMKMSKFDSVTKNLQKLVVELVKHLETKIERSLEMAKTPWRDRDTLIRNIEHYQNQLSHKHIKNDVEDYCTNDQCVATDISSSYLQSTIEELEKERAAGESLRQVVKSADALLRSSRLRINTLERRLKDTRTQLEESIRKHKEYEQLVLQAQIYQNYVCHRMRHLKHRSRETRYDARSRKLMQESKTGEETIEVLYRQRDALELRVKELQEQTKTIAEDYEARLAEQRSRMDAQKAKMIDQEKRRNTTEKRMLELEKRLKDLQEEHNQLKQCSEKLVNFNKEKCLEFLPRKEDEPSRGETDLWKDLQTTRLNLEKVTDELKRSRADKESLLESLSRIAQEGPEHKMADELLHREQKILRLQREIDELKETIKTMQETVQQKDSLLSSLRMQVGKISYDCFRNEDATKQDLELEVMDLSSKVATLKHERDSLVSAAASCALMLERHERCADLFAQVTRTRHEIIARLEGHSANRPNQESPPFIMDPSMRKSLSSVCMKASETWSELKAERQRVLQLQNIIVTQNRQMERESCIRTQLEERRATLERIFHTSGQFLPNSSKNNSPVTLCWP